MKRLFQQWTGLIFFLFLAPAVLFALSSINQDETFKSSRKQALEHYNQGQFKAALESEKIAYQVALGFYGPNHPFLASILGDLAEMRRNLGQYSEAEKNLKWGLALQEQVLEPGDPKLADTLEKLVDLYQDLGRYEDAYYLEKRAAAIQRGTKGFTGEGILLSRLGLLEMELGKTEESQKSLSQAVSLLGNSRVNNSLSQINPLQTRAELLIRLEKWDDAQKDLEKILEIEKNNYTGFGAQTADALRALGDFYTQRKMGDKSKSLYEQALKIYQKIILGNKGYPALSLMEKTAAAYRGVEGYAEALDLDTKALDVEKDVFGPNHPRTALCEARIALDDQLMGNSQQAQTHRQEAVATLKAALGDSHPLIQVIDKTISH